MKGQKFYVLYVEMVHNSNFTFIRQTVLDIKAWSAKWKK